MIKFLLSFLAIILVPFRLLVLLSFVLNFVLIIMISEFVLRDTYFGATETFLSVQEKAEKALLRSCSTGIQCLVQIYARDNENLKATFEKVRNEESVKGGVIHNARSHVKKLLSENDIRALILRKNADGACIVDVEDVLVCSTDELIAVFKAEKCPSCMERFRREFKSFEKKTSRNWLIKMAHKVHAFIFSFFGRKEDKSIISEATKEKIYEKINSF